jgi:signal transduction histidine kinase
VVTCPQKEEQNVVKVLAMPAPSITPRRLEIPCSHLPQPEEPRLDEVLGTVVHELRSPLASIMSGVSAIAEEGDVGPLSRQVLASIEQQLWQAMRLIDDLFDLSAGGMGKLSVQKEVVELADVIATASQAADKWITARQHELTISLPPQPLYLEADALRLTQVLTNLLCNAAKFTEPGGQILVIASLNDGQIVIRVQDNGRGIPQNLLSHVFDLFRQISDGHSTGGMGIGLALVKSLVELHDGTVAVYSNGPGTGSEFVVQLPAHAKDW